MADNMAETEENYSEVIKATRYKKADMEEKEEYMAIEMRRKPHCMKEATKKVKAKAYEYLDREGEKVKHEYHLRKNANQRRQEVERRLKRSEDLSMS